jgi:hypothetical protein
MFSWVSCWIFWQVWQFSVALRVIGSQLWCLWLFVEDYDVDAFADVFFWAAYFGAVAYGGNFTFKEACYAADG